MPVRNLTLLQTKLHRPRLPNDLVTRSRLVKLLNQDINHQLILVCAPAGFGKTTLVGNWLSTWLLVRVSRQPPCHQHGFRWMKMTAT